MKQTLQNLRERPKHEKTAIATWIAISVVAILLVGWLLYFFHTLVTTPAPDLQHIARSPSASDLQQASQQLQQAYGSSTQFIDTSEGVQLQEVNGTSTAPSL